jgi:hypothetical protein
MAVAMEAQQKILWDELEEDDGAISTSSSHRTATT